MPSFRDVLANSRSWSVDVGDVRDWLRQLPDDSVHCVVTSPPYYGLRDYGHSEQIGLEQTPEQYVSCMVDVFCEVRRVLHPSGVLWLNLGDSYNSAGRVGHGTLTGNKQQSNTASVIAGGRRPFAPQLKPKDLIGIPWMTAYALRADGWYLRQWMPWVKRNPMPESVSDRPGTACETIFLLTKKEDYFFDMQAVKRSSRTSWTSASFVPDSDKDKQFSGCAPSAANTASRSNRTDDPEESRNFRSGDLWIDSVGMLLADDGTLLGLDVPTQSYKEAHFATFPERLVSPLIRSGSSLKGVCPRCSAPWVRSVEKTRTASRPGTKSKVTGNNLTDGNRDPQRHITQVKTTGWSPSCACGLDTTVPAIVLDPFTGSGTTGAVARQLNRRFVGVELNPKYAELASRRIGAAVEGFL